MCTVRKIRTATLWNLLWVEHFYNFVLKVWSSFVKSLYTTWGTPLASFVMSYNLGVFTSDRWNKSVTTRVCIVYLRGVAFKRLHVSAFLHLGHHQVVSSLSRKLYNIYIMQYVKLCLCYNKISFLSIKPYYNINSWNIEYEYCKIEILSPYLWLKL